MVPFDGMPTLKLELSSMKHTVLMMLQDEALRMDDMLKDAVERTCTEGNLRAVVYETVTREMKNAVSEEIQRFFRHSTPGRAAIREAVLEHLNEYYPEKSA